MKPALPLLALGLLLGAPALAQPDTIGHWITELKSKDRKRQDLAREVLKRVGPKAIPALLEAYKQRAWLERHRAINVLGTVGPECIPHLLKFLADPFLQGGVVQALDDYGPAAKVAIPQLIPLLKSPTIDAVTAQTLGAIGPAAKVAVPDLIKVLRAGSQHGRAAAARALGKIGADPAKVVPALGKALTDSEWRTRREAADALARFGYAAQAAVPALRTAQQDTHEKVRGAAEKALVLVDPERLLEGKTTKAWIEALASKDRRKARSVLRRPPVPGLPLLIRALKDPRAKVRSGALAVLRVTLDGPRRAEGLAAMGKLLGDPDPGVRGDAADALGRFLELKEPWLRDALVPLLHDPQSEYPRRAAARALGYLGPLAKSAVPALRRLFGDSKRLVDAAMWAVGEIGGPLPKDAAAEVVAAIPKRGAISAAGRLRLRAAVPKLIALVGAKRTDMWTQEHALRALGRIGDPQAYKAVMRVAKRAKARNRPTAVEALGGLGKKRAVGFLIKRLEDPDRGVRAAAARGLGALEGKARKAIPALVKAAVRARSRIVEQALGAIAAMGPRDGRQAIPLLLRALTSLRGLEATRVCHTLRRLGPAAIPGLRSVLDTSQSEHVRRHAREALAALYADLVRGKQ